MVVRTLEPSEVTLHREVRLRALRDAPDSFGETWADVAGRPRTYWEELTRSVTAPGPHVMFLACEGKDVIGCAYGLIDHERRDHGRVGGMWVDPASRRRGNGDALLSAVVTWARGRGLRGLRLWAPAHTPAALALYGKAGFHETGIRKAMPTDRTLEIVEMARELRADPSP